MAKPIGVGLIGFGKSGTTFHGPLINQSKEFHLCSIVSRRKEEIQALYPDVRIDSDTGSILADPEIELIVVGTPNHLHASAAKAALLAGKNVLVEKPFTATVEEAEDLVALAEQKKLVLSVFHNRRTDGDFLTLKDLLQKGTLGKISSVESRFDRFRPEVGTKWKETAAVAGGLYFDLGSHLVDQALQLFGKPDRIFADLANQRKGSANCDFFHLTLYFGTMRCQLRGSNICQGPMHRFTVHGDGGSWIKLSVDPQETALEQGLDLSQASVREELAAQEVAHLYQTRSGKEKTTPEFPLQPGTWTEFYPRLYQAIREGAEPPVTARSALQVMEILHLGLESNRTGKVVEVVSS